MAVTKIIPIRFTIEKSIDYICNPKKTDDLLYLHSEHCVPQTAALTFQHHLRQARAGGNTIGRHLIQSFAPGEVSPETAHEIGKKLAAEILGGQYAYVMATHIDRGHIHNHFVWGAANVETHTRYRSNKRTYHEIRSASDRLCEEYSLSVIVPQGRGKSYFKYQQEKPLQGIIDIEGNEKIKSSPGYRQWAAIFNLKQKASALSLIQQYGGIEAFDELYKHAIGEKLSLAQELNGLDADIKSLSALRNNLRAYGRTKAIFKQYRDSKNKESFYHDHKADIDAHRAAQAALSRAKPPIPGAKAITVDIGRLRAQRADTAAEYKQNETRLKEMETIRKNLYSIIHQNRLHEQWRDADFSL